MRKKMYNIRNYRREMKKAKIANLRQSIKHYNIYTGNTWIKDYDRQNHCDIPEEKQYIKYAKNSNMQKYLKKYSNRRLRMTELEDVPLKGNYNRKYTEYWWILW